MAGHKQAPKVHHRPGCQSRRCDRWADAEAQRHRLRARRRREAREVSEGWAIPEAIVMCESGGQDLAPNSASASGFYQIIRETWDAYGGASFASEAWLASKAQQSIVARRIWTQGGPSQWVCKA